MQYIHILYTFSKRGLYDYILLESYLGHRNWRATEILLLPPKLYWWHRNCIGDTEIVHGNIEFLKVNFSKYVDCR